MGSREFQAFIRMNPGDNWNLRTLAAYLCVKRSVGYPKARIGNEEITDGIRYDVGIAR